MLNFPFYQSLEHDLSYTKTKLLILTLLKVIDFIHLTPTMYKYVLQHLFLFVLKSSSCVGLMEMLNCCSEVNS